MVTEPLLVGTMPISDFISVVLPMPLRPMIATISFGRDRDIEAMQHLALAVGDMQIARYASISALLRYPISARDRLR